MGRDEHVLHGNVPRHSLTNYWSLHNTHVSLNYHTTPLAFTRQSPVTSNPLLLTSGICKENDKPRDELLFFGGYLRDLHITKTDALERTPCIASYNFVL